MNILKIAMSIVFLYHGLTKNIKGFAKMFNLPILIASAVVFAEISGGIGYLISNFYDEEIYEYTITQWSSIAVMPVLLGAIYLVHWKNGFNVMNNGFEYQFILLSIATYLFIN